VVDPTLVPDAAGRRVACWHAGEPIALGMPTVSGVLDPEEVVDPEEVSA
jgi:hypothetical protein